MNVPSSRIRPQNDRPIDPGGAYVLYWMTAARRTRFNFGLQRAVELSIDLRKPLLILEAVRSGYRFASDRLHTFIIEGMRDNARACSATRATYYPYIEPDRDAGRGLIAQLSARACVVVTDWFPEFFLPRMTAAAAAQSPVRLEAVDGNGLLPVSEHGRAFPSARGYRALMQRTLRAQLAAFPEAQPLARLQQTGATVPGSIAARWPPAGLDESPAQIVARLPIDHSVAAADMTGGPSAAATMLHEFVSGKLGRYATEGKDPDADVTSRLSPYLHFGHISSHEVFSTVMTHERWTSRKLGNVRAGARQGWWNVTAGAEQFLDQIVVWRELAFNAAAWTPGHHSYAAVPVWARATLEAHLGDPRPHLYTLEELEAGATADVVWNAAQNELRETGWCHGYMRMVWGKKILEWSPDPATALERMGVLMDRHSLDGRDPVSYLNYGWVLGRYDRPWFDRPIFGTVRYMTSESARRKLQMRSYLSRFAGPR